MRYMANLDHGLFVSQQGILELIINRSETKDGVIITPLSTGKFIKASEAVSIMSRQTESQILPNNCKYFTTSTTNTTLVIEEPPRIRTIKIKASVLGKEIEMLRKTGKMKEFKIDEFLSKSEKVYQGDVYYELSLSFPYVIFIMAIGFYNGMYSSSGSKVYLKTSPIKNLNDRLIKSPTTNFDGHAICSPADPSTTIKGVAESVIRGFWNALFTDHGSTTYFQYLDRDINVSSWLMWQYLSLRDPNFVFSEDWIYHDNTLAEILEGMVNRSTHINEFINLFTVRNSPDASNYETSFYHEFLVRSKLGSFLLCQGDEIEYDGNVYFVDYFVKPRGGDLTMILDPIEDNKDKVKIRMDQKIADEIVKQKSKKEITEITIGKKHLKTGDIITYKYLGGQRSGLIKKIRKNRIGIVEVKLSGNYFTLLTEEFINSFDVKFDGSDHVNKRFIVETRSGMRRPYATPFHDGELIDVSDSGGDEVSFRFKDSKGRDFSAPSNGCVLHEYNEYSKGLEKHPVMENNGLLYINCKWVSSDGYEYFIKGDQILVKRSVTCETYYHPNTSEDIEEALNKALSKDEDGISIKSTKRDINLNVGDTVCVFGLLGQVTVGSITGFVKNLSTYSIDVEIEDANGVKTSHQYVKILTSRYYGSRSFANGCVYSRTIVKLHPKAGNIVAGSKIISKVPRIPNFPKGNVNMILGFVFDFGAPLAVASNGHTIWCDDGFTNIFDVINPSEKSYNLKKYLLNYRLGTYSPIIGDLTRYDSSNELLTIFEYGQRVVNCYLTTTPEIAYTLYKRDLRPYGLLFPRFINDVSTIKENSEGDNNV